MLLEELQQAQNRSVGIKQAEKAVLRDKAVKVYIAEDADLRVLESLVAMCEEKNVALVKTATMSELGRACGIHVNAAAAVILKD